MAKSICVRCGEGSFELVEREPTHSTVKYNFVQCAKCGGVVGVVEPYSITTLIYNLAAALKVKLP